uniref:Uncharacterized protein n=1 Tax=Electrophorus electricus TaxID=8005 RepID=A0A4W4FTS6_ELEEL
MENLQHRQTVLQGLQSQMQDFEAGLVPLQDWITRTEVTVQESSARLHDLPAKRLELSKLQVHPHAADTPSTARISGSAKQTVKKTSLKLVPEPISSYRPVS